MLALKAWGKMLVEVDVYVKVNIILNDYDAKNQPIHTLYRSCRQALHFQSYE